MIFCFSDCQITCHKDCKDHVVVECRQKNSFQPKGNFLSQLRKISDVVPDFKSRKTITKCRCSDHNLLIEKGRHLEGFNWRRNTCSMCLSCLDSTKRTTSPNYQSTIVRPWLSLNVPPFQLRKTYYYFPKQNEPIKNRHALLILCTLCLRTRQMLV